MQFISQVVLWPEPGADAVKSKVCERKIIDRSDVLFCEAVVGKTNEKRRKKGKKGKEVKGMP
jgi:hypothetical protein